MTDNKPDIVRRLESEFHCFLDSRLVGLSAAEVAPLREFYVDKRLSWEVENRGYLTILKIIGFCTLMILVGLLVFYLASGWEEGHRKQLIGELSHRIDRLKADQN